MTTSVPLFLQALLGDHDAQPPDFYTLFRDRMNSDQRILAELRNHIDLTCGTLDNLLRLASQHGDGAREFLASLAAEQRISCSNLERIARFSDVKEEEAWPKALDVHTIASKGDSHPHRDHCLTLGLAAFQLSGHHARRDAIHSMLSLKDRYEGVGALRSRGSLKERVLDSCTGIEEALKSVSLFRGGLGAELSEYLDLLALFVWADLQAQDRRAASVSAIDASDEHGLPRGSSRLSMHRIVASLRALNFGIAGASDFYDVENSFLSIALFCPGQRRTLPLTLCAIVCAVARRLGVAATLVNTPFRILIVAVEEAAQPADSISTKEEWERFFVSPDNPEEKFVAESGQVTNFLRAHGIPATQLSSTSPLFEPASPLAILQRVASNIIAALQNEGDPRLPHSDRQHGNQAGPAYPQEDDVINLASSADPLASLRLYVSGRSATPPYPLDSVTLASSLDSLPSTHVHSERSTSFPLRLDAKYCAMWVLRLFAPHQLGGSLAAANMLLLNQMAGNANSAAFLADVGLLQDGLAGEEAASELKVAKDESDGVAQEEEGSESSEEEEGDLGRRHPLRGYAGQIFDSDRELCDGMGCLGGDGQEAAQYGIHSPEGRDRSHPSNDAVEYGVGTVFTHRRFGYRAVIVGWDSYCRKGEAWIRQMRVDSLPSGGRHQPFYSVFVEDDSERNVAQCNIEPAIIPAGATQEEKTEKLHDFVGLLSLPSVGKCFRTVAIEETGESGKTVPGNDEGDASAEGHIRLRMNAWLQTAWPFD
ncbi:YccV-like-domain-containing protein [Jaminaea rosea]|uniref:YccV-like-domain-containing protein n=1 Tax=Jaminaea rosea TaxID=1569628 RepID=A0A316UJD4_9BASI|nr:YccV-like-domain-containing protein [Jaminaea rosea]PWN24451.1 YccV-like-domain-containing protein [Jaminaea rosea]